MRYPAEQTAKKHQRILDEAARLFRERGFAGAGVAEIMKAAGLTHGAFYAHFDSKDALNAAATEHALAQSQQRLDTAMAGATDKKLAFLAAYLSPQHRDEKGLGCAMAALGVEVGREPAARGPFTSRLKQRIDDMVERFDWPDEAGARDDAIHMLAAAVGALILARAVDDPEFSDEILKSVRETLTSVGP